MTYSNKLKTARAILETSNNACDCTCDDYTLSELKELMTTIIDKMESEDDFWLDELGYGEVRVIDKEAIAELWHEGLIQTIKDCYDFADTLENIPDWVACHIDWDQTAENCKVDGLGHHFASYDHEEHNTETHYIFRTN